VGIINSALFHGGFLTGGDKFDYLDLDPDAEEGRMIYRWREDFHAVCKDHDVIPGDACLHFGLSHPAIVSIALNTSRPEKMERNAEILNRTIPPSFWDTMKDYGLISADYPYL
jgi:D-threo-aldose 1-dehydrogenase